MSHKLENGTEDVGHLEGLLDAESAAYLKLDERGAVVSVPRASGLAMFREIASEPNDHTPPHLRFQTTSGVLHLADCFNAGTSASSRGVGVTRIRAPRVIDGGNTVADYSLVDGMTSELDGLSTFMNMSTVSMEVEHNSDDLGAKAVVLRAEHQESIRLGGAAHATVESSWGFDPNPKGNVFEITDVALLRTRSDDLWPWRKHAAVHHMFQDLMCLVYGRPCLNRVRSVKREDDQPYLDSPEDHRRTWRPAYEPGFGRSLTGLEPLNRAKAIPLFRWSEADPDRVRSWIDEWDLWSRPTWIAVTTMFQRGTTVESRLLQIGVALEALGHAIWTDSGGEGPTPSYPGLLNRVIEATGVEHKSIYRDLEPTEWAARFNASFKGSKHADNPLPEGLEARDLSNEGMNLIRCWLAKRLGVSDEVLLKGIGRHNR